MYNETQHDATEARRRRKRELDRKSQRLSRQRTKSRITQLEGIVEDLRQNHPNAKLLSLMHQLDQVTEERDNLLKVLDSLSSTIHVHLGDSATNNPAPDAEFESTRDVSTRVPVPLVLEEQMVSSTTTRVSSETSSSDAQTSPVNSYPNNPYAYDGWNSTIINEPYSSITTCNDGNLSQEMNPFVQAYNYTC